MKEVYAFLKKCDTYFIATMDGDQPRVRPFGTIDFFENKLYIQTGKVKAVSKQMHANPKVEICGLVNGKWMRIEALAVEDDRAEARAHMLEAYPALKAMYAVDDGNTEVFYLKDIKATLYALGEAPQVIKLQ